MRLGGTRNTVLLTDAVESDFFNVTSLESLTDWKAQTFNKSQADSLGPYGEMFSADDIVVKSGSNTGLQLVVGSTSEIVDGMVPTAEIATRQADFFYGSYRASIKMARNRGTCAAFYWVC